jgi:hypothetical protein
MKLGLGVLLAIAGLFVTAGGVWGVVFYFKECFGAAGGSFEAEVCQRFSVVPVTAAWAIGGLILDAAAVAVIRFRAAPWLQLSHYPADGRG